MKREGTKSKEELLAELKAAHARLEELEKSLVFERERADSAHMNSEATFWEVINNAPLGILMFDNQGVVTRANKFFAQIMGAEAPEQIVGIDMLRDVGSQKVRECVRQVLLEGQSSYQGDYTSLSGKKNVYIRVRLVRLNHSVNLGVFEDLSEYRELVTALSSSELKHRVVLENLAELVMVISEGKLEYANPVCEKKLGLSARELVGRQLLDFVADEFKDAVGTGCADTYGGKESEFHHVIQTVAVTGERRWMSIIACKVDWDGKRSVLATLNDVTDRIKAEEDLAELNLNLTATVEERTRDIVAQARELEEANQKLLELDALKNAFISSVSHELRTPLTAILGFAAMTDKHFVKHFLPLAEGMPRISKKADLIRGNLDIIKLDAQRLSRLVNDVLDLARIESGQMPWTESQVPVDELVSEAVRYAQGDFQENGDVELIVPKLEALPTILMDKDKMLQVLRNLLHNASKFTLKGGVTIVATLSSFGERDMVEIRVKDTGPGIPPEEIDAVFDRFYQTSNTTDINKPQGSGLGLYLSRQIVERHGGRLYAESLLGQGTDFVIRLPVS